MSFYAGSRLTGVAEPSALPADALWVNNLTGSDSYTKAQILAGQGALAWRSLMRGTWGNTNRAGSPTTSEAVSAGQTLYVVNTGTPYSHTWSHADESLGPAFAPCNAGTAANPIIIEAYGVTLGSQWVELRPQAGAFANIIGAYGVAASPGSLSAGHIEWRGFMIDETVQDDSDSWPCYCVGARNVTIEYCKFLGDGALTARGDNHNATRFQYCLNCTVRNCYISGFYAGDGGSEENGNGCEFYWSGGITFEHNYVTDCGMGWFAKAPNHVQDSATNIWAVAPHYCRFNHFHDCEQGLSPHRLDNTTEANGFYIYQNLLTQIRGTCVRFKTFPSDSFTPHHTKFFNNTIWSDEAAQPEFEVFTDDNVVFKVNSAILCQNNVIKIAVALEGFHGAGATSAYNNLATYHSNRNCWDISTAAAGNFFEGLGNASYTTWRGLGQDADSGAGRTTVTFVSAGTDFRLASNGQAALDRGRVLYGIGGTTGATIRCGCYITGTEEIGIEAP